MNTFDYQKDKDGIVTVTMNMDGPVNLVNESYYPSMAATVERLEQEQDLAGVIIASAKQTFFAGADLNELHTYSQPDKPCGWQENKFKEVEYFKSLMRRLEKLPVPKVAAINGAALGAGYELCLCCNYRLAWNAADVVVGFPEVILGILPGGGGVVRLTKMLGLSQALPFLVNGRHIQVAKAVEAGLVDGLTDSREQLLPRAREWILENKSNQMAALQPWDRQPHRVSCLESMSNNAEVFMEAGALFKKHRGLLPAVEEILYVAVEALRLDIDTALRIETRAFLKVSQTPQANNMITTFFQKNQVKSGASRPAGIAKSRVKKVGVLGAGLMGQGIAYVSAVAGIEVVLKDVSPESAEKGKAYTATLLDKQIARGEKCEADKQLVLERILATAAEADLHGCDLIIEAVFENMSLKQELIASLEPMLAENGIWGSNTSTLPISMLAQASANAANVIGIHFFSPVDKMRLVEIICGQGTNDETLARAFDYVKQIGKTPIVVGDSLGFFTSRVFGTQLTEGAKLVTEGIHPNRVENLAKAIGMPVGPLTSYDEVSMRLVIEIANTQLEIGLAEPADDPLPEATALIRAMVDVHKRGGRHHGGGFYEYTEAGKQIWPKLLQLYYREEVDITDEDIKDRLFFRPVLESLKCLEEGVLRTVADGNIGSLLGIGAPAWTGGYIQFVNSYGLDKFVRRCDELAAKYGERFKAPQIALDAAHSGSLLQ